MLLSQTALIQICFDQRWYCAPELLEECIKLLAPSLCWYIHLFHMSTVFIQSILLSDLYLFNHENCLFILWSYLIFVLSWKLRTISHSANNMFCKGRLDHSPFQMLLMCNLGSWHTAIRLYIYVYIQNMLWNYWIGVIIHMSVSSRIIMAMIVLLGCVLPKLLLLSGFLLTTRM